MKLRTGAGVIAVAVALIVAAPARADTVTDWNANATSALIGTAGQPPHVSAVSLAMVHGAVYDAVNAIDGGREGYLLSARLATPSDSKEAAAATAAYRVLAQLVPAQQTPLASQYAASLAGIPDGAAKTRGIAVGEAAAAAMLAARSEDGRGGPFRFVTGSAAGAWRPGLPAFASDPNAWIKDIRPFLIRSSSQFRSNGPLPLTSRAYARDFDEVKSVGALASSTRSADQTLASRYWNEHPTNTWSRIFRTLAAQENLSMVDSARLFAELYLTAADSFISVWEDKAHYSYWRPITAIREAAADGNPRTEPDAEWLPLIPTPPYPDHPSGHTGLSGSIVATLQQFFRTDRIAWTDTNNGGLTRSFTRFSEAIDEIVDVRVWSGIHFRTADEQGRRIGEQVARWREHRYFQPASR
jgi:hypothetical protein